jgi:tetratricopeptide (TPR) repeat protein
VARGLFLTCLAGLIFGAVLSAQQQPAPPEPPEEDESLAPQQYALNPVQAAKEITAGNFYFKKGNYAAAIRRYTEAARWDPGSEEAFLKLGEASEKAREYATARDAFLKCAELIKDPKQAEALRKRAAKLPHSDQSAKVRSQAQPTQPLDNVPDPDAVTSRPLPHTRRK